MEFSDFFNNDSIDKQVVIAVDGQSYTNEDLAFEEMEIEEQLCSDKALRFGKCEASTFKVRILNNVMQFSNKKIGVSIVLNGKQEYVIGTYRVKTDKPTADKKYRDITAYDTMHDIINANVIDWYNTILPDDNSEVTLREFRYSFFAYFGIEQVEVSLVNDDMKIKKTIQSSKLSGKTVATAICEINGCFGHIGRNGKFQYIFLKEMAEGLYPSDTLYPSNDLFPRDAINVKQINRSHYISATYEDFITAKINKLQIRQEEDDIGYIYGDGNNCYVVQDNFLLYGKSTAELSVIAEQMYSIISKVEYRPAHVEAKGNPCLEVGDGIRLATKHEVVSTYILQRTLKGIQALRDTYDAEGEQYQREKVNGTNEEIRQLKGKTNKLTRTIEETRMEISDIEKGLSSRITQNAEYIGTEVARAIAAEDELNSLIIQTAEQIKLEVNQTYTTQTYVQSTVDNLQQQIDGAIETHTGSVVPTLSNAPAGSWMTNVIKDAHIGDLYMVNSDGGDYAGFYYRFEKNGTEYNWVLLKDSEVTKALQDAADAMTRANAVGNDLKTNYSTTIQMNSAINAKADEITLAVSKTYETKTDSESKRDELSGKITLNADNITAEVKRAQAQEVELAAAISVNAANINLKVTKGNISSEISQESGKISIKSNRFALESTNCTIAEDGTISAKNVDLSGKISASSGSIGGFDIGNTSIYSGSKSSIDSSLEGVYVGTDGISVGKADLGPAFKVTKTGDISFKGNGSIEFGVAGVFSNSTYIDGSKVKVGNNYIDTNGFHCGGASSVYTKVGACELSLYRDYNSFLTLDDNNITFGTGDKHYIKNATYSLMMFDTNVAHMCAGTVGIGSVSGYLGFFYNGSTSTYSKKQTVSTITTPSSATASTVATKLNELLTALKAYNLIG